MAKVYCVILDADQMPRAKALLTDIRGKNAFVELVKGSYSDDDFTKRETIKMRIINADNQPETYQGRIAYRQENRMELAEFELLSMTEKREDVKVLLNKPVLIICKGQDGGMRKSTATLRDISAGGVCIVTPEDIPENGGEFEMVYDLTAIVDVLKARVVHKRRLESGEYCYGCQFIDLHFTQEHSVREFVFKRHLGLLTHTWRQDRKPYYKQSIPS